jgi:hypothetical protein
VGEGDKSAGWPIDPAFSHNLKPPALAGGRSHIPVVFYAGYSAFCAGDIPGVRCHVDAAFHFFLNDTIDYENTTLRHF